MSETFDDYERELGGSGAAEDKTFDDFEKELGQVAAPPVATALREQGGEMTQERFRGVVSGLVKGPPESGDVFDVTQNSVDVGLKREILTRMGGRQMPLAEPRAELKPGVPDFRRDLNVESIEDEWTRVLREAGRDPASVTRQEAEAILERLPKPPEVTTGQQVAAGAGTVMEGFWAPQAGLMRKGLETAEGLAVAMGSDPEKARESARVGRMAGEAVENPFRQQMAINAISEEDPTGERGREQYARAAEALNPVGRDLLHLLGSLPGIHATISGAKAGLGRLPAAGPAAHGLGKFATSAGLGTYTTLSSGGDLEAGGEAAVFGAIASGLGAPVQRWLSKIPAVQRSQVVKALADVAEGGANFGTAGQLLRWAKGEGFDADALRHEIMLGAGLGAFGAVARAPKERTKRRALSLREAGEAKGKVLEEGTAVDLRTGERVPVKPEEVVSEGRLKTLQEEGPEALMAKEPEATDGGKNVEAGYVPVEEARQKGLIAPEAEAAVREVEKAGAKPFSSHVDEQGVGSALGQMPDGENVRAESRPEEVRGAEEQQGGPLREQSQQVEGQGPRDQDVPEVNRDVLQDRPQEQAREVALPAEGAPEQTSLKRATTDRELVEAGYNPVEREAAKEWNNQVAAEASAILAKRKGRGAELVNELEEKPRPLEGGGVERAILLRYKVETVVKRNQADQASLDAASRGEMEKAATEAKNAVKHNEELLRIARVAASSARESARDLAFQAAMQDVPGTLEDIQMRFSRANEGKPLDAKQQTEAKALYAEHQKALARITELETKLAEQAASQAVTKMKRERAPAPERKAYGSKNKVVTVDAYRAALAELGRPTLGANPFADPAKWKAAAKIGAYHIEAGARSFADFAKKIAADLGEGVRPYLKSLYEESKKLLAETSREDALAKIRARAEKGEQPTNREVQRLGEALIDSGIEKLVPLAKEAHRIISEVHPDVTYRDVLEAFGNYGVRRKLSDDPTATKRRELQGQARELLKMESMLEGEAPLASGFEMQLPGPLQREYRQIVNEMKKAGEWGSKDREGAIKSALSSAKTRLKNQLADLQRAIDTHTRLPDRTRLEYDAEAKALRDHRDALKKVYDSIFVRRGLSDEQRIKIAQAALERSVAEYERRISEGDLFPKPKGAKAPESPVLDALRARRDALKEEVKRLQKIERPPKTPEQKALDRLLKRVQKREEQLAKTEATGELQRPVRTVIEDTPEMIRARAELQKVNEKIAKAEFKIILKKRKLAQKLYDWTIRQPLSLPKGIAASMDLSFLARQGWFQMLAHPIMSGKALMESLPALMSQAPKGEGRSRGRRIFDAIFNRESKQYEFAEQKIKSDPEYLDAVKADVNFVDHSSPDPRRQAEEYQGRLSEHIPGVGATGRQFALQGNLTRLKAFKLLRRAFGNGERKPSLEADKIYANFVNVTTGRPSLGHGKLDAFVAGVGPIMWAARFAISRVQALTLQPVWTFKAPWTAETLRARAVVLSEYIRVAGGLMTVYLLAEAAGAETPMRKVIFGDDTDTADPKSSDFGKIKVGERRFDFGAGLSQFFTYFTRLATGEKRQLAKPGRKQGEVVSLTDGGFAKQTRMSETVQFGRKKLGPGAGLVGDWLAGGRNVIGEEQTPATVARDLTVPLAIRDMAEGLEKDGWPTGLAYGMAAIFGAGMWVKDNDKKSSTTSRRRSTPSILRSR